jgi:hypothetical protein
MKVRDAAQRLCHRSAFRRLYNIKTPQLDKEASWSLAVVSIKWGAIWCQVGTCFWCNENETQNMHISLVISNSAKRIRAWEQSKGATRNFTNRSPTSFRCIYYFHENKGREICRPYIPHLDCNSLNISGRWKGIRESCTEDSNAHVHSTWFLRQYHGFRK